MGMRILLLLAIGWIMGLKSDLVTIPAFWTGVEGDSHGVSGRDLILLIGGLFLIYKSTHEIHNKLEGEEHHASEGGKAGRGFRQGDHPDHPDRHRLLARLGHHRRRHGQDRARQGMGGHDGDDLGGGGIGRRDAVRVGRHRPVR